MGPQNPDRPSYDLWGNKWSYNGKLLKVGKCPYIDPISKSPNPYCPHKKSIPAQTTTKPKPNKINQCGGK